MFDRLDVFVGQILHLFLRLLAVVLGHVLVLLRLLQVLDGVAADVAQGDLRLLAEFLRQLDEVAPTLLVERRDGDADDLAVVHRVEAEVRGEDRLVDEGDGGAVVRLDRERVGVEDGDVAELVERRERAVVIDPYAVEQGGGGLPGADLGQLAAERFDRFVHAVGCVLDDFLDHFVSSVTGRGASPSAPRAALTSVPMSSPSSRRRRLPGTLMLNTMMGRLFSRQRVMAVRSMIRRSRRSTSRYEISSKRKASGFFSGS